MIKRYSFSHQTEGRGNYDMKHFIFISFLSFVFFAAYGFAEEGKDPQQQLTLEEIQKMDDLNEAKRLLQQFREATNNMSKIKYSNCFKAFGDNKFCQCLTSKLPVPISFGYYVQIVTTPKNELGYSQLSQEDKKVVDVTLEAREICVGEK
jgi:hypothetical protein